MKKVFACDHGTPWTAKSTIHAPCRDYHRVISYNELEIRVCWHETCQPPWAFIGAAGLRKSA